MPDDRKRMKVAGTKIRRYEPDIAIRVIEGVMEGKTLPAALKGSGISSVTWYKWLALYPQLKQAYNAARELSAERLEEKALDVADKLAGEHEYAGTYIQGLSAAMTQWRWSAERRDPAKFGAKKETSVIVPVQINTTLDLGDEGETEVFNFQPPSQQLEVESSSSNPFDLDFGPEPETQALEQTPEAVVLDEIKATIEAIDPREDMVIPKGRGRGRPKGSRKGHKMAPDRAKAKATRFRNQQLAAERAKMEQNPDE